MKKVNLNSMDFLMSLVFTYRTALGIHLRKEFGTTNLFVGNLLLLSPFNLNPTGTSDVSLLKSYI